MNEKEKARWEEIKAVFRQSQKTKTFGGNHMAQLLAQIEQVSHALYGIRSAIFDQQVYRLNGDGLESGSVGKI